MVYLSDYHQMASGAGRLSPCEERPGAVKHGLHISFEMNPAHLSRTQRWVRGLVDNLGIRFTPVVSGTQDERFSCGSKGPVALNSSVA